MMWSKDSQKDAGEQRADGQESGMRGDAAADRASGEHVIVMYGTPWCGDCRRAKRVFADMGVDYQYVDISEDDDAAALVMRLNRGMRSVPTILFPDGSVLVEPGYAELAEKVAAFGAA